MRHKLVLVFLLTSLASLGINIFVYVNLNTALYKMDEVYSSNISLNNISDSLEKIHVSLTGFLETKGTDELETYYKYEQEIKNQLLDLNGLPTDNTSKLTERTIRMMSENYLLVANSAVTAKRGRNIMEYTKRYQECQQLYNYLIISKQCQLCQVCQINFVFCLVIRKKLSTFAVRNTLKDTRTWNIELRKSRRTMASSTAPIAHL